MKPDRPPLFLIVPPHCASLIRAYADHKGWAPEDAALLALMTRFAPETTAAEFADEARK